MVARPGSFAVVLPVKSPGTGKSRLSALPDDARRRLAAAFAVDAVAACRATPEVGLVVVVSDDDAFAASLAGDVVVASADPGEGLNGALRHGARVAREVAPGLRPAALLADVPALSPGDLSTALQHALAQDVPCFVVDADGTGTTLYTAPPALFDPRFGEGSARAHHDAGARPVPGDLVTLRRDVDDLDGLAAAVALGVGTATAAALP
ncbi:2-phospho-L-lactate guanylyltransferase [Nocardioides sp. J9]|uniref:2-phospho-L-lactate guanylyltransferase n=1 Tax=unclassified Nocardioides TaxID=2615069 RepID=UPI00048F1217|nr:MULTISPECIES: 2-phospho-L-lactate guanylyltransferase [unclassified Nocardioides]TWG98342.1 2-phospho-L-lactate guanylyltransferase [Nocardioides sp. J9]